MIIWKICIHLFINYIYSTICCDIIIYMIRSDHMSYYSYIFSISCQLKIKSSLPVKVFSKLVSLSYFLPSILLYKWHIHIGILHFSFNFKFLACWVISNNFLVNLLFTMLVFETIKISPHLKIWAKRVRIGIVLLISIGWQEKSTKA